MSQTRKSGAAPYGMTRRGKNLTVDEDEQQVIQAIRHGHEAGFGWQAIADRLNQHGHRTRRGTRFRRQTVFMIWKRLLSQEPF